MNILITGVAGLIGARLADYFAETMPDAKIVGVDSLFGGYMDNVNQNVEFYKRDLAVDSVKDLFQKHHFDYVFHFAAYAAEGLSPFIRKFNYANNVGSTANIVNECINFDVKRLVYTSSMSVYGNGITPGEVFTEDDSCMPIDPYGISKYACEMDIKVAGEQHGLDWCIIRPHNVFGAKQNIWDKYRNVLGIWMNKILHGEDMLIYGDGEQTRAFTYIDNILPCLAEAAFSDKASKQIVNLGGMVPMTINAAAESLCRIAGCGSIQYAEKRHEVKFAVPSYQKSIDILKYSEKTGVEEGLQKMWEWAKTQPDRGQYKWPEYEINKGIYSYWK